MFKGNQGGAFAIGLISGISGTVIILLFGESLYELANCVTKAEHCASASRNENSDEPQWWYWSRRLVAAEDTLAQWVMAFFTFAATVILIFTLRSANKTNRAAIAATYAANLSNKIMRDEQRPWLVIKNITIEGGTVGMGTINGTKTEVFSAVLRWRFKNIGKAPARVGWSGMASDLMDVGDKSPSFARFNEGFKDSEATNIKGSFLAPNDCSDHWGLVSWGISDDTSMAIVGRFGIGVRYTDHHGTASFATQTQGVIGRHRDVATHQVNEAMTKSGIEDGSHIPGVGQIFTVQMD